MRSPRRIKPIIEYLRKYMKKNNLTLVKSLIELEILPDNIQELKEIKHDSKELETISEFWEVQYDLRLSQVLVSNDIINNAPGFWFYIEDIDVFSNHIDPAELYSWGTYGIDGTEPLKYLTVKEMNTEHLKKVLETQTIYYKLKKVMEDEFKKRNKTL